MSRRSSAVHVSNAGSKQLLIAIATVIAITCGGSPPSAAASWSSNGKLVVNISPRAFIRANASIWIYLADLDYGHNHLIGRRRVAGNPPSIDRVVVNVASGNYGIFLLKKEGKYDSLKETSCYVKISVTSGSETEVDLPVASSSSCFRASEFYDPGGLPFRWGDVLYDHYNVQWVRASAAIPESGPDPFWIDLDKLVSEAERKYCPEISSALEKVHRQVVANRPSEPILFVKGTAIGPWRPSWLQRSSLIANNDGALHNMDFDADLVRLAVADVKARCWDWFLGSGSMGPPRGADADLYEQDKKAVQLNLAKLDQLNEIADILDQVAHEQGQQ